MMRHALVFLTLASFACSAAPSADDASSSEAAFTLRPRNLLGTLAVGQTSPSVEFVAADGWKAYAFTGHAGQTVTATVTSSVSADKPYPIVMDSLTHRFEIGSYVAGSSSVTAHLPTDGTYYIAYTVSIDPSQDDATNVVVSLAGGGGAGGGPGGADPLDAASCTGADLTRDDIRALLAGAASTSLGDYTVYERHRECNALHDCRSWSASTPLARTGTMKVTANPSLFARLDVVDDSVFSSECPSTGGHGFSCSLESGSSGTCWGSGPYGLGATRPGPAALCEAHEMGIGGDVATNGRYYGGWTFKLASHCAQWVGSQTKTYGDNSGYTEYQAGSLVTF